jgi:hypothetical protein
VRAEPNGLALSHWPMLAWWSTKSAVSKLVFLFGGESLYEEDDGERLRNELEEV